MSKSTEKLEAGRTTLPAGHTLAREDRPAPRIQAVSSSALRGRLAAFLPAMANANTELDAQIATHGTDAVTVDGEAAAHGEGPTIQFDLAIGEMKESDGSASDDAASDTASDDDDSLHLPSTGTMPKPGNTRARIESISSES